MYGSADRAMPRRWRCQVDEHRPVVTLGEGGLPRGVGMGHLAPDLERDVACGTVLVGGQAMATKLDVIVDARVAGQKPLCVAH